MTSSKSIAPPPTKASDGTFGLTKFDGVKSQQGHRRALKWPRIALAFSTKPMDAENRTKESLPGWSPAYFSDDRRKKANVEKVFGLALDYDNKWTELNAAGGGDVHPLPSGELVTIEAALRAWEGCHALVYSSYSHTSCWPRFRLVVPFARSVSATEYMTIWRWAEKRLRACGQAIDEQCKDPSRFWFIPAKKDDNFVGVVREGEYLDVGRILGGAS